MQQNISSQFKYTIDLGLSATKTTFKVKKTRKDLVTHILIIVFTFIFSLCLLTVQTWIVSYALEFLFYLGM